MASASRRGAAVPVTTAVPPTATTAVPVTTGADFVDEHETRFNLLPVNLSTVHKELSLEGVFTRFKFDVAKALREPRPVVQQDHRVQNVSVSPKYFRHVRGGHIARETFDV
jgi:hypothetical protein